MPVFLFSEDLTVNPAFPGKVTKKVGLVELYEYVIGADLPMAKPNGFLLKYASTCSLISLFSLSSSDIVVPVDPILNL